MPGLDGDHEKRSERRDEHGQNPPKGKRTERHPPAAKIGDHQSIHGKQKEDQQDVQFVRTHHIDFTRLQVKRQEVEHKFCLETRE